MRRFYINSIFILTIALLVGSCTNSNDSAYVNKITPDKAAAGEKEIKPAVPEKGALSTTQELKYIFDTDQEDRYNGTFLSDKIRDSLRLARVQELYQEEKINTLSEKYYAAFIFTHAGGPFAEIDPKNFLIAHQLFTEVSEESCDETIREEALVFSKTAYAKYLEHAITDTSDLSQAISEYYKNLNYNRPVRSCG